MKKKLLTILLIAVIVFNFICVSTVYADADDLSRDLSRYGGNATIKGEAAQEYVDNGKSPDGKTQTESNFGVSFVGIILQYVASIIDIFPMTIQNMLSVFTANPNSYKGMGFNEAVISTIGAGATHFTIERTVFNEVAIFNIDFFNTGETFTNGLGSHTETIYQQKSNMDIKESVAKWFYTCRIFAMMINAVVLIYVGIRMAISTIASEEAKYKKMLIDWAESMILLFLLHYIMYAMIYLGQVILNVINGLRYSAIADGGLVSFEDIIINNIYLAFTTTSGVQLAMYSLFFWFLTGLHIKFFLTYMKRMFTVMFLAIIAPFITVTFPIDKMGDGKAQAFEAWFKELLINILIQPIHAGIYLVFVYTAGKIAEKAPIVAMIFLLSLGRIENMVRNVFKITDSVGNVDEATKGGGGGKKGGGMHLLHMFGKKE